MAMRLQPIAAARERKRRFPTHDRGDWLAQLVRSALAYRGGCTWSAGLTCELHSGESRMAASAHQHRDGEPLSVARDEPALFDVRKRLQQVRRITPVGFWEW